MVDVEYLKNFTKYDGRYRGTSPPAAIDYFWEVMRELSEEQKMKYLQWVNGRAKLPNNMSDISYKHTITWMGGGDGVLPQAHVCYFQIDLPEYTTKEILKQRLVLAIEYCGEIDTDNSASGVRMTEYINTADDEIVLRQQVSQGAEEDYDY